MAIEDIRNFVAVSDALGTGGQPTEEQLHQIAHAGYAVVINLGLLDPRYCLPDEASLAQSLELEYHHIPVDFQAPTSQNLSRFSEVMDASAGKKVFVHCAANYRVSSFVALYGQSKFGWTPEQADAHIKRIWEPNEVWSRFIATARQESQSQ
ncbi:MAG: protein tyrosine phosphatase family protein [Terriglobia bacterium]